ncbi:asparagine synthase-related protein [Tengunoibacter tsumagoiensis]|uniref:asparagine synthase (glutamine-hydrolyzing) n=1 Tax=Tengunoibacter tsumagoiensis TaxID=2014871 RepID=A0A401ZY56_9CHLR|nr:asparagine synthase-related protein [Tengunoibacter tsumagoiensis]GCE11777.1 hypothetical protein KTT_16360 [Tengunoibacter tsumagoiensis]
MPILAGWLTGEQVPNEIIEQTIQAMGTVLARHGGEATRLIQPGMGLITFSDSAYALSEAHEPPALDWVPERRTLVYRRPLSGSHALYFIEDWPATGNLLFASEIQALLNIGVPRRLHVKALEALQRYGFIPAPWTAFQDIQIVPAGSILRWQRAKTVLNQALDYPSEELHQPQDQLQLALQKAWRSYLSPSTRSAALVSGGEASSLAALWALQQGQDALTIATLGEPSSSDRQWLRAEQVAQRGAEEFLAITPDHDLSFWLATIAALESPALSTHSLALHQLLHTVAVEAGARIAISGLGARTLFGQPFQHLSGPMDREPVHLWQNYQHFVNDQSSMPQIWSPEALAHLRTAQPWEETLHARKLERRAVQFTDRQQGFTYLDLHLRLPDGLVHPAQKLATEEQMVLRSPFLTQQVLPLLACLPDTSGDGAHKSDLLKGFLRSFAFEQDTLVEDFTLAVPSIVSNLATPDLLHEMLSETSLQKTGLFDTKSVQQLLQGSIGMEFSSPLYFIFTTQLLAHLFGAQGL